MEKLIIVRHGITANNAAKRIQGTLDVPLSEAGKMQAEKLGEALAGKSFDLILSSPQRRALSTAEAVAKHHGLTVHTDVALRERCFGVFEGGPRADYQAALAASGLARWDFRPEGGGETIHEVWARCGIFLDGLKDSSAHSVLIAAHEAINRCLILMLLGQPVSNWTSIQQANCCINRFAFHADGTLASHSLNETTHLPATA